MPAVPAPRAANAGPSIPRDYVRYLQARLLEAEAEASLAAMSEKYERIPRSASTAATYMRAGAPPLRAGVKARVGARAGPVRALIRPVLLLDVLAQDGRGWAADCPGEV